MKKSNLLLENLKNKNNFNILFNGDDLDIEYWKYDENDNYYHGIIKDMVIYRLSIEDMKRAIVDDNYFIKLDLI